MPPLGLASDAIPGLLDVVRVDTARTGTFTGAATIVSGEGHETMAFTLRILPADAYEARQKTSLAHCEAP